MVYVIMGVSGCGKTTIGGLLAASLGLPFFDADDFHPARNIGKMQAGMPLDDDDRAPWLALLARKIAEWNGAGSAVLACSALRERYRAVLGGTSPRSVVFIYLRGDRDLVLRRLRARPGHFMPASLLDSQFAALEEPADALTVPIDGAPEQVLSLVREGLGARNLIPGVRSEGACMANADIGIFGLGVMGQNIALNCERHGFTVAVYNRTASDDEVRATAAFLDGRCAGKRILAADTPGKLAGMLRRPRKILLMVTAGVAVDEVIAALLPHLEPGDIVIDGGNSNHADTARRLGMLESEGLHFIGAGISGGEEGALNGPAIMPGGSAAAWDAVAPVLEAVAARNGDGRPCVAWIGPGGAGHFVKMVHNGIEYAIMQAIAESYDVMRRLPGMNAAGLYDIFTSWNEGPLHSYLIGITADIFRERDADGLPLIDRILDRAGEKGTGRETALAALELGACAPLFGEAINARLVSGLIDVRRDLAPLYPGAEGGSPAREPLLRDLHDACRAVFIIAFQNGFSLLRAAAAAYGWELPLADIAAIWRGGCIIQCRMLGDIERALRDAGGEALIIGHPSFVSALNACVPGWRRAVAAAIAVGIPLPVTASALSWFDGMRSERGPANLLQAQRDFFGAHRYERTDAPRGEFFHTTWGKA